MATLVVLLTLEPISNMDGLCHELLMKLTTMANMRYPKIKKISACNKKLKDKDNTFLLGFSNHIKHFNDHLTLGWKLHTPTLPQNQSPQPWIFNKRKRLIAFCNV